MFLKNGLFLFVMAAGIQIKAAEFIIRPNEIKISCDRSRLTARIEALSTLTESKTHLVSALAGGEGFCAAALEYLKIDQPTTAVFDSHIREVDDPINILPCYTSMSKCSAIYRYSKLEILKVFFKNIVLLNEVEIPGSQKEHLVEWDSRICPPFRPDCDL